MRYVLAAVLTAILTSISWPANGSLTPLIFVAFLPVLWMEQHIRTSGGRRKGLRIFLFAWLAFGLFNLLTTWWVSYAHWTGTFATTVINGALMATVFWLYHLVARGVGETRALLVMPFLWMCVEYLHLDWDMSFPWLNLGYVFANRVTWIQWYEYTGIWGGTLWVWWVNAALFATWRRIGAGRLRYARWALLMVLMIGGPVLVSVIRYAGYESVGEPVEVVVVQPNLDPYETKFNLSALETVEHFTSLARPYLDNNVDYLIGPETMLQGGLEESMLEGHPAIRSLRELALKYPRLHVVTGATTFAIYDESNKSATARAMGDRQRYYDAYNTSLQIHRNEPIPLYHKSKLVVGVEKMPFEPVLKPLLGDGIDLGGIVGTLGTQEERDVFVNHLLDSLAIGTIICWEADFGSYTAEYVRNGAALLFAITNDGWWSNTPGKDQHLHYARVRAIENRRDIARSANTGISCVINQRGDVSNLIEWEETGAFRTSLLASNAITFYTRTGDLIGRIALFISLIVMLSVFVRLLRWRDPSLKPPVEK